MAKIKKLRKDYIHWWATDDFKYEKSLPYCHSQDCNKDRRGHSRERKVLKKVPFTIIFCPDCGEALVWSKESEKGETTNE